MTIRTAFYAYYAFVFVGLVLILINVALAAHDASCWQSVPTVPGTSNVEYQTVNVCN